MKGRVDPKLQGKGEYGGDWKNVPCCHDHEPKVAAHQIFPLFKTGQWYSPTVKHHCPRVALASSLRACSNKVSFDPKLYAKFAKVVRAKYIPEFLEYLNGESEIKVDIDLWLLKFPEAYRKRLLEAIDRNHKSFGKCICKKYSAFTKVELQHSDVPHEYKETELNDAKERQICGPCNEKKMALNALINVLERIASENMKAYCGRANWLQICEGLDKIDAKIDEPYWGASDGSGFDMTQYPEMNQLIHELIMKSAEHPNVVLDERLGLVEMKDCLDKSLLLDVSMDNGDLRYQAVGRASGDGWTTFGNTMLMIWYWQFTFEEVAKIPRHRYGLKVKGDDVLFCLSRYHFGTLKLAIPVVFTDRKDFHEHGLGQICKKVNFGDITDLDFLSNEFFRTNEGKLRMTRIPARVVQSLAWTTRLPPNGEESHRRELCFAKGMCLKAWADGLPIFSVLADKMIQIGKPGKLSNTREYADPDRVWHQGRDDADAYRKYLEDMYMITVHDIVSIERKIQSIKSIQGWVDMPEMEKFYKHTHL